MAAAYVFHCCEHWDFLFWTPLVPLVADVDVLLLKGKLGAMLERLKIRLSPRNHQTNAPKKSFRIKYLFYSINVVTTKNVHNSQHV